MVAGYPGGEKGRQKKPWQKTGKAGRVGESEREGSKDRSQKRSKAPKKKKEKNKDSKQKRESGQRKRGDSLSFTPHTHAQEKESGVNPSALRLV